MKATMTASEKEECCNCFKPNIDAHGRCRACGKPEYSLAGATQPPERADLKTWLRFPSGIRRLSQESAVCSVITSVWEHKGCTLVRTMGDEFVLTELPHDTETSDSMQGPWTPLWKVPTPEELRKKELDDLTKLIAKQEEEKKSALANLQELHARRQKLLDGDKKKEAVSDKAANP